MRLVLDPGAWNRARLEKDPEASSWADSLSRDGERHTILRLELVGEGVLAVDEILRGPWKSDQIYTSNSCRACGGRDFLYVRRRHGGPVPPQVLAAFEPQDGGAP